MTQVDSRILAKGLSNLSIWIFKSISPIASRDRESGAFLVAGIELILFIRCDQSAINRILCKFPAGSMVGARNETCFAKTVEHSREIYNTIIKNLIASPCTRQCTTFIILSLGKSLNV